MACLRSKSPGFEILAKKFSSRMIEKGTPNVRCLRQKGDRVYVRQPAPAMRSTVVQSRSELISRRIDTTCVRLFMTDEDASI
jgi:hypothetical protein